jgi:hypothetical protein
MKGSESVAFIRKQILEQKDDLYSFLGKVDKEIYC